MEINHDQIQLIKEIGSGEFGVVMRAMATHLPNCEPVVSVAVKVMKQHLSQSMTNAFIREGLRLKDLDHENVVKLLAVCLKAEPLYIVLEYMPYGDMKSLLRHCKTNNITLNLDHLMCLSLDTCRGLQYLQYRNFVHRDLAARNVLINGSFSAKIGDFGE